MHMRDRKSTGKTDKAVINEAIVAIIEGAVSQ